MGWPFWVLLVSWLAVVASHIFTLRLCHRVTQDLFKVRRAVIAEGRVGSRSWDAVGETLGYPTEEVDPPRHYTDEDSSEFYINLN